MATVLKTVISASLSRVQIPAPPPIQAERSLQQPAEHDKSMVVCAHAPQVRPEARDQDQLLLGGWPEDLELCGCAEVERSHPSHFVDELAATGVRYMNP